VRVRDAGTIWHEQGGWFDARWQREGWYEPGRLIRSLHGRPFRNAGA
jgi:hypothetical protein